MEFPRGLFLLNMLPVGRLNTETEGRARNDLKCVWKGSHLDCLVFQVLGLGLDSIWQGGEGPQALDYHSLVNCGDGGTWPWSSSQTGERWGAGKGWGVTCTSFPPPEAPASIWAYCLLTLSQSWQGRCWFGLGPNGFLRRRNWVIVKNIIKFPKAAPLPPTDMLFNDIFKLFTGNLVFPYFSKGKERKCVSVSGKGAGNTSLYCSPSCPSCFCSHTGTWHLTRHSWPLCLWWLFAIFENHLINTTIA